MPNPNPQNQASASLFGIGGFPTERPPPPTCCQLMEIQ